MVVRLRVWKIFIDEKLSVSGKGLEQRELKDLGNETLGDGPYRALGTKAMGKGKFHDNGGGQDGVL